MNRIIINSSIIICKNGYKSMIDFIKAKAQILTRDHISYDISSIVDQRENSITIEFLDMDRLSRVRKTYSIPEDFENNTIYLKGKANALLLDYFECKKKINALNASICALDLDKNDEAYRLLTDKVNEIEKSLDSLENAFYQEALKSAPEWDYIIRDSHELDKKLVSLPLAIEHAIELQTEVANYSGLKLKKYKDLYKRSVSALEYANNSIIDFKKMEQRLKELYSEVGVQYSLKYNSLEYGDLTSLQRTLNALRTIVQRITIENNVLYFPPNFYCTKKESGYYRFVDSNGYSISVYSGKNKRLENIDTSIKEFTIINCGDGDIIRYYTTEYSHSFNATPDYYYGKPYYLEDIQHPGKVYSLEITKDVIDDNDNDKEVDERIGKLKDLMFDGGFNRRNI